MFAPLKENIGGHKFKYDRDVEAVATRRLITRDRGLQCKQGLATLVTRWDVSCAEVHVAKVVFIHSFIHVQAIYNRHQ